MTQIEMAWAGQISAEMAQAVASENIDAGKLRGIIAAGRAVIPKNKGRQFSRVFAIGEGLRTKVNANIGTSGACTGLEREKEKLEAAVAAGADSVMVGAVPIYGVASRLRFAGKPLAEMDPDDLLRSIERQCAAGLDYITVHCGVTRDAVKRLKHYERIMPSVSPRRLHPHALDGEKQQGGSPLRGLRRTSRHRLCPRCNPEYGGWFPPGHSDGCHRRGPGRTLGGYCQGTSGGNRKGPADVYGPARPGLGGDDGSGDRSGDGQSQGAAQRGQGDLHHVR